MHYLRCWSPIFRVLLVVIGCSLFGCSGAEPTAPKEFSDTQKQQIQEYKKQATDEWGNKVK